MRMLVKDGVEQVGMTMEAAGRRVRRKCDGSGKDKALAKIAERGRSGATARELGIAMVDGTERGWRMSDGAKELLGLATGTGLVRAGLAVVTRGNRFMLKQFEAKAVPPALRVEDVPAPGFVRVPERP
jgi:hypothetical protein